MDIPQAAMRNPQPTASSQRCDSCCLRICALFVFVEMARNVALLLNDASSWYLWGGLLLSIFVFIYVVRCLRRVTAHAKESRDVV